MTQILGIKFSDHGPVCYFGSGGHEVSLGQAVLVETDQGLALGRVATLAVPEATTVAHVVQEAHVALPGASEASPAEPAPFDLSLGISDWDSRQEPARQEPARQEPRPADDVNTDAPHAAMDDEDASVSVPVALFASDQAIPQSRPHSLRGLQSISRLATETDLEAHGENRRLARRAFTFCRGCIGELNLDMKLVDVEVLHDRSKMIFFFTAPNRIDFRELIKSLVREFHTRIELRQIGVRHETQMIGAIGNCGQVVCCRRFLRKFAPVTIKMAKEQNLFLNPAKISGICGRLLCCLSYEQKGYEEFHKQCPKIGKRIQTPLGNVKVLRANFFKKSISVWVEDAGEREFTLDEWKEILARKPGDPAPEAPVQEQQGRSGGGRSSGRPSTGRPTRPERAPKPPRGQAQGQPEARPDARPEARPDARPEATEATHAEARPDMRNAASPAGADDAPDTTAAPGEGRSRPRRKRRKSKGPKPAQ